MGIIKQISEIGNNPRLLPREPVFVVVEFGRVGNDSERLKALMTDGHDKIIGMFAAQNYKLYQSGAFKAGCNVKLKNYVTQTMNDKTIIIIVIDAEVEPEKSTISSSNYPSYGQPTPHTHVPHHGSAVTAHDTDIATSSFSSALSPITASSPAFVSVNVSAPGTTHINPSATSKNNPPSSRGGPSERQIINAGLRTENVVPIAAMNPYSTNCTILACITRKHDIGTWQNSRGSGPLFSIDLMDQQGTEIKATFFNEACEKFYPILQEDSVYTFAVCKIKVAFQRKNQTPKTTGNQYELEFTTSSQICLATDVSFDTVVPVVHFIKIDKIAAQEVEGIVDVLGIVKAATNCHEIKSSKNSRVFQKRDLLIYDDSLTEVRVTLWDKYATDSTIDLVNTIISFRGMKISDFGGKSLSSIPTSRVMVYPAFPEAHALHEWQHSGVQLELKSLSQLAGAEDVDSFDRRKSTAYFRDRGVGAGETPDYCSLKAVITYFHLDPAKPPWYNACPVEGCNKKVTELEAQGGWFCDKCNKAVHSFERRFVLSMILVDHAGQRWATAFNEVAEKILGHSASELCGMLEDGEDGQRAYEKVFVAASYKTYVVRTRAKVQTFDRVTKLQVSVIRVAEVDSVKESEGMLKAIDTLAAMP